MDEESAPVSAPPPTDAKWLEAIAWALVRADPTIDGEHHTHRDVKMPTARTVLFALRPLIDRVQGVSESQRNVVIFGQTRAERIEHALLELASGAPSTKGLPPRDRAERLHAEIERRAAVAKAALRYGHWNTQNEWVPEP